MEIKNLISMENHGPEITEDDVLRFERALGCRLPEDYREFLLVFNGGQPSLEQVIFPVNKDSSILNCFYSIEDTSHGIEDNYEFFKSDNEFPRELLAIGYDGTGSRVCLVIHGGKRGQVWFNDLLDPHEPKLFLEWYERKRDFKKLADSFTEFIQMLRPYDED